MTRDPLDFIPATLRDRVAQLVAEAIEQAASVGYRQWGLTSVPYGLRLNVGWTEILTAHPKNMRLIVNGEQARRTPLPKGISLTDGDNGQSFYRTIPGSVLAEVPYEPRVLYIRTIELLRPALTTAIRLAARRPAGRTVKAGHSQQAVRALAAIVGRALPAPEYVNEPHGLTERGLSLMEGAMRRVVSSKYERNRNARDACVEHYGASCSVCGFLFERVLGHRASGFIHVHHLVPLTAIAREYRVDPVEDLRPVCPNCHAMLHFKDPPFTIAQLKKIVAKYHDV